MGIRFICPNGHRLHVKAFLAGKRGICPHCASRFDIPLADAGRVPAVGGAGLAARGSRGSARGPTRPTAHPAGRMAANGASGATAIAEPSCEAGPEAWYVRPAEGGQWGPADEPLVRQWIREGRLAADSLVWRADWAEWRRAGDVFAELQSLRGGVLPVAAPLARGVLSLDDFPDQATSLGASGALSAKASHLPRPEKNRARRLVIALSLAVIALAVALVFVVVYLGQR